MAAGIPGAGIGGLFYLASALWLPVRALLRRDEHVSSRDARRRQGVRLAAMAMAILALIWLTGVIVGLLVPEASQRAMRGSVGPVALQGNSVWQTGAMLLSFGTLALVLGAVQIARLTLARGRRDEARNARVRRGGVRDGRDVLLGVAALLLLPIGYRDTIGAQSQRSAAAPSAPTATTDEARRLVRDGHTDAAIRELERHVRQTPGDAEAWQLLAEQRRRAGRLPEALAALDRAESLEPSARRRQRRATWAREAAMQFEPSAGGTRDSDENTTTRAAIAVRSPMFGRAAVTASGGYTRAADPLTSVNQRSGLVGVLWRPRAAVDASVAVGGAMRSAVQYQGAIDAPPAASPADDGGPAMIGSARLRLRAPAAGPALDLRASRVALDVTPLLLANDVRRDEVAATLEIPLISGLRGRILGRAGQFRARTETANTRTMLGGAIAAPVRGWGEIAVNAQQIGMMRPTAAGYFAPRRAQIGELSTYLERESEGGTVLAIDAGAGVQRMEDFTMVAMGRWQPALRLWSHLDVPVSAAALLRAEVDIYDGGVARDASVAAARWRWMSASVGVRIRP